MRPAALSLRALRRNRFLYGLMFSLTGGAGLVYGDLYIWTAFYCLALLPALTLIYALFSLYGISLESRMKNKTAVKNERNSFVFVFKNKTLLGSGALRARFKTDDFAIELEESESEINLRFLERFAEIELNFKPKYRGTYEIGLASLEITDFLGLFILRKKIKRSFALLVFPAILPIKAERDAARLLSSVNAYLAQEDEYMDARPYLISDPMKKIHWKLTAKKGEWMVKNYASGAQTSVTIIIDPNYSTDRRETRLRLEDAITERAVALTHVCLSANIPVELLFGSRIKESARNMGGFGALYNLIAELAFNERGYSLENELSKRLSADLGAQNVIILTALPNKALERQILEGARFGHNISLISFS